MTLGHLMQRLRFRGRRVTIEMRTRHPYAVALFCVAAIRALLAGRRLLAKVTFNGRRVTAPDFVLSPRGRTRLATGLVLWARRNLRAGAPRIAGLNSHKLVGTA